MVRCAQPVDGVGRARREPLDQRVAVRRNVIDGIAGIRQRPQHADRARRRIEADAVAEPAVLVRVVGEHDGDPPLGRRRPPESNPVGRELRHEFDPVRLRLVGDDVGLGQRVAPRDALERHGAADNAPVDLRQRDVHRDIARRQSLRAVAPGGGIAAGEDHLQHRAIAGGERPGRVPPAVSPAPGVATAKPVEFRMMSGGASASRLCRIAAESGSFRLVT